jgi:hypothetical protein
MSDLDFTFSGFSLSTLNGRSACEIGFRGFKKSFEIISGEKGWAFEKA